MFLFKIDFASASHGGPEKLKFVSSHISGLIAAFSDFDSDRFTDVFIISNHGKTFKLVRSFEDEPQLREWDSIQCSFMNETITGIIPADFNGDALMDVMIITQSLHQSHHHLLHHHHQPRVLQKLWIFRGNKTTLDCDRTVPIDSQHKPLVENIFGHPLLLDYNGDMVTDFLVETENCSRELWSLSVTMKSNNECLEKLFGSEPMRTPNSNAFVNVRNCQPDSIDYSTDIVITNRNKIEYWLNREGFLPENKIHIRYPDESVYIVGQSAFVDLNIDGCIEHIMAVCKKEFIHDTPCLPQILWFDNKQKEWFNIADFTNATTLYFEVIDTIFGFQLPISIRFGDYDRDGYVDLVTVMKNKTESGAVKQVAVILKNVPDDLMPSRRKFVIYWTTENYFNNEDVELASFLDLKENGKLEVILTTKNSSKIYDIKWIPNKLIDNSCFLKVLVTSGLCSEFCPNEHVPYGTNQVGPFICYETSDINGRRIKGCSAQMSQTAYFALQTPYSIFGLGETPNFVETVIASIPSGDKPVRKSKWTQIVPDAQVVLIPYPPNATSFWICKLFYTPSSMVSSTLAALALICGLLIVIILILHRREVLEDSTEHEEYKRHWPESR